VRIDSRTTVSGTITACRFVGTIPAGRNERPQFEVTMSCGTIGAVRTFVVAKLP
jgi:hypothetical protein